MRYTETDFADALSSLRPALIRAARRFRRCSWEDAEDLVSQAALIALRQLSQYDPESGRDGLRRWLHSILVWVVRTDKLREARQVETTPLETGVSLPASESLVGQVRALFRALPRNQRVLVSEWLQGYNQQDIARRHHLHRNTVGIRLESAFATLRTALPRAGAITYSGRLPGFCSRVSLYVKPKDVWPPWFQQHPPEVHFARYRRRLQAARERERLEKEAKAEENAAGNKLLPP